MNRFEFLEKAKVEMQMLNTRSTILGKLKLDLQLFNDLPALLSKGTVVEYQTSEQQWLEVAAVTSVPDIGGDPDTIDATHLQSERHVEIPGLDSAESLTFSIIYQGSNFADLHVLHASQAQTNFRITYPDGLQVTMRGVARLAMSAAEVNARLDFTLTIVCSEGPDFVVA